MALIETIKGPILERTGELLTAPIRHPDMIWMVIPLVITMLLMTIYFGKYKREELGWNTALGNSLVLLFISIDLLRYIFNLSDPGSVVNYSTHVIETIVVIVILLLGFLLLWTNFAHLLPRRVAFFISQPVIINVIAYVELSVAYANLRVDWITFFSGIFLMVVLGICLMIFKLTVRETIKLVKFGKEKEEIGDAKRLEREIEEKKEILIERKKEEQEELKIRKEKQKVLAQAIKESLMPPKRSIKARRPVKKSRKKRPIKKKRSVKKKPKKRKKRR